jgi:hypothetical protein
MMKKSTQCSIEEKAKAIQRAPLKTSPGFVENDKVFFVRKGQGALVNKRQRRSIEEEAEVLL